MTAFNPAGAEGPNLASGAGVVCGAEIASEVARRVVEATMRRAEPPESARLGEIVQETLYCEERRLVHRDDEPGARDDRRFLASVRRGLAHADEERELELVYRIVERYVEEIAGEFDSRIYKVATRALPLALGTLLHGLRRGGERPGPSQWTTNLDDRIRIGGHIDQLRALARVGTVVLAPSHVSNLDSVVLGWVLYRLGLPPFAYGAGRNLFSNAIVGFFLRNLGAYTVDRAKTDPLYRQTLKEYATVLLEHGQHSLFFPGGTRSRSGGVEQHLKLGLLGTLPVALRHELADRTPRRPVIVPCTLTYPLVLEAETLIGDYLRAEGRAKYIDRRDEFDRPTRWLAFLRGLIDLDLVIHVEIGKPMDVVGNDVDSEGRSVDRSGRVIDPASYLSVAGKLAEDGERDAEYTRLVAARLVEAYRRDTVALPTSVLAFAVFEHLRKHHAQPDVFRLLSSIRPDASVPLDMVTADVARLCAELGQLEAGGRVRLSSDLCGGGSIVVRRALETFGTYHPRPVITRRGQQLVVGSASLLFYYRNRLDGLGLLGTPDALRPPPQGDGREASARC